MKNFLRLCKVKVAEYTNSHMDKIDGKTDHSTVCVRGMEL